MRVRVLYKGIKQTDRQQLLAGRSNYMSIKCRTFYDYNSCTNNINKFVGAATQVEEFIEDNNIDITNIKDIKFSIDSRNREHILLVYMEEDNNEE